MVKPYISPSARKRMDSFWQNYSVDEMVSTWGDSNISTIYKLCRGYNKDYIRYIIKENPDLIIRDVDNRKVNFDKIIVSISKFAPILYEDYLNLRRENKSSHVL